MKINKLILSGLLSCFCLFAMGSSCGGAEQPNHDQEKPQDETPGKEPQVVTPVENPQDETPEEQPQVEIPVEKPHEVVYGQVSRDKIIAECCEVQTSNTTSVSELTCLNNIKETLQFSQDNEEEIMSFYRSKYPGEDVPSFAIDSSFIFEAVKEKKQFFCTVTE